jgi:hypothetical protein
MRERERELVNCDRTTEPTFSLVSIKKSEATRESSFFMAFQLSSYHCEPLSKIDDIGEKKRQRLEKLIQFVGQAYVCHAIKSQMNERHGREMGI